MEKCAIVVPVWKKMLSEPEIMSLIQCASVLGKNGEYGMTFIMPERLSERYYKFILEATDGELSARSVFLKLPDRCFESRLSYSHMMSSKQFYGLFSEFEYILLYQLDAWVFSDYLSEWCEKGYDYVGAPWCHLCRMGKGDCEKYRSTSFVGNGGLSLRKVSTFAEKLPYDGFEDAVYGDDLLMEDVYVSMVNTLSRPKCDEACAFSVETNARFLVENVLGGSLPFGFHALNVYDRIYYNELVGKSFVGKDVIGKLKGGN